MKNIDRDILNCSILIIEDDYLGRTIIKEIFKQQGFTRVEDAENGVDGLEKISTFCPNLVVLDCIMPEMDGIECCKRIRQNSDPKIANVPVLFQTSLDGIADKARFFEAGATDYLSKPIDPHEITARAVVHLESEVMIKKQNDYKTRMGQELDTARLTQRILIPSDKAIANVEKDYKLRISGHYEPCSELGGDFWGFKSISHNELAIYMVDFAGHGVNAALNVFRLHALMQAMDTANTPSAFLTQLNAHLAPLLPIGHFATMFYGVIDTKHNTLSYASAASPTPILFTSGGSEYKLLESSGTVLGAVKDSTYKMIEVDFNKGDCLLLYSDALVETPTQKDEAISIDKWADYFRTNLKKKIQSSTDVMDLLLKEFRLNCSANLKDDLTINAYYRNG